MSLGSRRRYVAVPAGSYPAPSPPRRVRAAPPGDFAGEPEPTLEGPAIDFDDGLAAAVSGRSDAAASIDAGAVLTFVPEALPAAPPAPSARGAAPDEPDLGALLSGPISPTFASLGSDYARATAALDDTPPAAYGDPAVRRSSRLGAVRPGRMLLGAAVGAVLGLLASVALLTLLPGHADGPELNPVILWQSAESRMQLMVGLVTVGCALLGSAFGARGGSPRRSS